MKSELLKQRDVVEDGIPYGNIKIRIDEERVELQQDKDLIFISKEKLSEFVKIINEGCDVESVIQEFEKDLAKCKLEIDKLSEYNDCESRRMMAFFDGKSSSLTKAINKLRECPFLYKNKIVVSMTAGGNRPGSGAKKKENPKENKTFRVDPIVYKKAKELYGGKLNQKINEFLKSLVEI